VGAHLLTKHVLSEARGTFWDVHNMIITDVSGEVIYQLTSLWVNASQQLIGVAYP
jgi:hypothetical protein